MKTALFSENKALQERELPDAPGVYFFLGRNKEILYIGRATSLRNRARSYFAPRIGEKRGPQIARMIREADAIDFQKTGSVLEAVLLEAKLIKKFTPPYNTELKDDKSFNCVVITKEPFPAVLVIRAKDIDFNELTANSYKLKALYGPFPDGRQLKIALKIIRRIFPYRDVRCKQQGKPCFNRQIGLCPGACTGEISKKDYAKIMRNIRLLFEGKKPRLLRLLKREMKEAAKAQKFERAGELKKQLFALAHIQDVALLKRESSDSAPRYYLSRESPPRQTSLRGSMPVPRLRIEAYDLSHFGGKEIVGAMAVVEGGAAVPREYRLFGIRGVTRQNESAGLQEIIRRRFNHPGWAIPDIIAVDGNEVQKRAAEAALAETGRSIPVAAVVKDERHRPSQIIGDELLVVPSSYIPRNVGISVRWRELRAAILLANSEAHRFALKFQRRRRRLPASLR